MRVSGNPNIVMYGYVTTGQDVILLVTSIVSVKPGMNLTGTGIPDGSRVVSVDRVAKSLVSSKPCSATGKARLELAWPPQASVSDVQVTDPGDMLCVVNFVEHGAAILLSHGGAVSLLTDGGLLPLWEHDDVLRVGAFVERSCDVCLDVLTSAGCRLVCFDKAGGVSMFELPELNVVAGSCSVTVHGDFLYCAGVDGALYELDGSSGVTVRKRETTEEALRYLTGPVCSDGELLFASCDDRFDGLYRFDVSSLEPLEQTETGRGAGMVRVTADGDVIYKLGVSPFRVRVVNKIDRLRRYSPSVAVARSPGIERLHAYDDTVLAMACDASDGGLQALRMNISTAKSDLIHFDNFAGRRLSGIATDAFSLYASDPESGLVRVYERP